MNVLVINSGSSSLKFQLIDVESGVFSAKGLCERIGITGGQLVYETSDGIVHKIQQEMKNHTEAIRITLDVLIDKEVGVVKNLKEIDAIGHRIAHGGDKFTQAAYLDEATIKEVEACIVLAPLHNPANVQGMIACKELMPETPMVGVFDTAFHRTMPEKAYLYGIPYGYYKDYKIQRYGFHGSSHSYVSERAAKLLDIPLENSKIIVCHLGNGSSISAIKNGKCIDTSMGFTPLEGLIMGTRAGDIDPTVLEFIAKKEEITMEEVLAIINKKSGVLGLSNGLSSDFRDLTEAYQEGNKDAIRAIESFCYRVAKYIGSYMITLGGVDAICFTAGVGENSEFIRKLICEEYLGCLGIKLDAKANDCRGKECVISSNPLGAQALVIPTNEELTIARETKKVLQDLFG